MATDFWSQVLEASPETAYYSASPFGQYSPRNPWGGSEFVQGGEGVTQGGYSPVQQQYWSGQYGNVYNQYLGQIGRSLRGGQEPATTFMEYLDQYPFTQRYSALGPAMRPGGCGSSRYSPSTRYMF